METKPFFAPTVLVRTSVAIVSVCAATVLRMLLSPLLGDAIPFATLFFAVLVTAWHGGFRSALLAAALGAILSLLFLLPPNPKSISGYERHTGLVLYLIVSFGIAVLGGAMQRTRELCEEQTREALQQREQWQSTFLSIGDGVIVTDAHGIVTTLNPRAEELTGWSKLDAEGQPLPLVFRILHDQTRKTVENPVEKVQASASERSGRKLSQTVLVRRDGSERFIETTDGPIRNARLELVGVVFVFRDISERIIAERKIHESESRFRVMADAAPVLIWMAGPDKRCDWFNRPWLEFRGRTLQDEQGTGWLEGVHPEDLPRFLSAYEEAFEARKPFRSIYRLKRYDGVHRWIVNQVAPRHAPDGTFTGYVGSCTDIHEQKQVEQNMRFLADCSGALAAVVDYESTLQKVARLAVPYFADWCAIDMLESDGSLRRVAAVHLDPAKVELAHELHRRTPLDPAARTGPAYILRTGKSELVSEITDEMLQQSIKDAGLLNIVRELGLRSFMGVPLIVRGNPVGVITFISAESGTRYKPRDLTLAEDLAQRAAVAIENSQLYQELRTADHRKDEFLAVLAHELRNPLAPIRNAMYILKAGRDNPVLVEQSREMAERQVFHLTRLVDDLLDVSRIMRGKIELRRERMELVNLIARAVETARPAIDTEHHELTVDLPSEQVWLEADAVRLAQVVSNILLNAAKYTPAGGKIHLSVNREGRDVVISVRDNGIGMDAETLPRIFEMFMQVAPNEARSQGGLGIGLTLVRNLVEMHNGRVEARSAGLNQGSEFIVRLPAVRDDDGETHESREAKKKSSLVLVSPRKILVVDDNIDAALSLAMLLRLDGHTVRVAHSGEEGIAAIAEDPPEFVLLDIGMPGMDGHAVARHLQSLPGREKMVLVALTGWGQEQDRQRSKLAGFDHHLTKPVEPSVLNRLLAGKPQA